MEKKDLYNIAIVGPQNAILGFKALGLKPVSANTVPEVVEALTDLKKETVGEGEKARAKYAIIFVIEDLMKEIPRDDYKKLSHGTLPAIVPIPGPKGSSGFGNVRLGRMIEQAVGSDIFANN